MNTGVKSAYPSFAPRANAFNHLGFTVTSRLYN